MYTDANDNFEKIVFRWSWKFGNNVTESDFTAADSINFEPLISFFLVDFSDE